jgi:hypothetical protein
MHPLYDRTEADDVAENMNVSGIVTMADAEAYVRRTMGTPEEVGYQIFDNVAEALFRRAVSLK